MRLEKLKALIEKYNAYSLSYGEFIKLSKIERRYNEEIWNLPI